MVIRFSRAGRFLLICLLLALTAAVSIGTRSISVFAPYAQANALPVVVYRAVSTPGSADANDLRADLRYLQKKGYVPLQEAELVASLRHETELPPKAVLLLFDDEDPLFPTHLYPVLQNAQVPWLSLRQLPVLLQELRTAGRPVQHLERAGGLALDWLFAQKKVRAD